MNQALLFPLRPLEVPAAHDSILCFVLIRCLFAVPLSLLVALQRRARQRGDAGEGGGVAGIPALLPEAGRAHTRGLIHLGLGPGPGPLRLQRDLSVALRARYWCTRTRNWPVAHRAISMLLNRFTNCKPTVKP